MSKTTYTIPKKMSNSGSIHDLASDQVDREIVFSPGCKYAVVCAAYYGGKGYTTHKTAESAIKASERMTQSHQIIDSVGNHYDNNGRNDLFVSQRAPQLDEDGDDSPSM